MLIKQLFQYNKREDLIKYNYEDIVPNRTLNECLTLLRIKHLYQALQHLANNKELSLCYT